MKRPRPWINAWLAIAVFIAGIGVAPVLAQDGILPPTAAGLRYLAPYAGAQSRTIQSRLGEVISVKDFGARCDGVTNDAAALQAAISAAAGVNAGAVVELPAGVCAFSEPVAGFGLYSNAPVSIRGAGMQRTTLRNLSSTGAGVRLGWGYQSLEDLTIDQNGSTGVGLRVNGQHSSVRNVSVINQSGASTYAMVVDGATLAYVENVLLIGTNGLDVGPSMPTFYVTFSHVTVVNTFGRAVRVNRSAALRFYSLYVDPGDAKGAVQESIHITASEGINFYSLAAELAEGPVAPLRPAAYFVIDSSRSVNIWGGQINHTGTASRSLFRVSGKGSGNILFEGMSIFSTKPGMVLFDIGDTALVAGVTVRNIRTTLSAAATGVRTSYTASNLVVEQWSDSNAGSSHTIDAINLRMANVTGAIKATARPRLVFENIAEEIVVGGATYAAGNLLHDAAGRITSYVPEFVLPISDSPSAGAPCPPGRVTWDSAYIYICTASGVWKRAALTGY